MSWRGRDSSTSSWVCLSRTVLPINSYHDWGYALGVLMAVDGQRINVRPCWSARVAMWRRVAPPVERTFTIQKGCENIVAQWHIYLWQVGLPTPKVGLESWGKDGATRKKLELASGAILQYVGHVVLWQKMCHRNFCHLPLQELKKRPDANSKPAFAWNPRPLLEALWRRGGVAASLWLGWMELAFLFWYICCGGKVNLGSRWSCQDSWAKWIQIAHSNWLRLDWFKLSTI